jgi:hypothetical protein
MTLRSEYRAYLASSWWKNRKRDYYATHERECAGCGGAESIVLHHKTYARLGAELDDDLVSVCGLCHKRIHLHHKANRADGLAANTDVVLNHVRVVGIPGANPLGSHRERKRRAKEEEAAGGAPRRTSRGRQYDAYIVSDVWVARREAYFTTHERRCIGCGTTEEVVLHHRTYARSGKGRELDMDLAAVCRSCHHAIHAYHKLRHGSLDKATKTVLAHIRASGEPGTYPEVTRRPRVRHKKVPRKNRAG